MMTRPRVSRARALLLLALAATAVSPLVAQRADSADAARKLYRDSRTALSQGDQENGFKAAVATAAAWPRQGAYVRFLARVAATTGHPDAALDALDMLTDMGFDWTPADSTWSALSGNARFQALSKRALDAIAPMARSTESATLPPSFHHAEGVAFDSRTGRRFVGSVRQRKIVTIDATGQTSDFIVNPEPALYSVFGMSADAARRVLWVTTSATAEMEGSPGADSGKSELRAYHLDSRLPLGRWRLPATEPHCLGDVVQGPDDAVYATDSCQPTVWRATLDGQLTSLPWLHRDWRNLQGLAFAPSGCTAWIADWTTGLYRIDLASNTVTPVAADPRIVTLGIDGLYWAGAGRLIGLQNGITPDRVVELLLNKEGTAIEKLNVLDRNPRATEPTLGYVLEDALVYVANSAWENYGAESKPMGAWPQQLLLKLPVPGLKPIPRMTGAPNCR